MERAKRPRNGLERGCSSCRCECKGISDNGVKGQGSDGPAAPAFRIMPAWWVAQGCPATSLQPMGRAGAPRCSPARAPPPAWQRLNPPGAASFQGCHHNLHRFPALLSPGLLPKYHWFNFLQEVINTREPGWGAAWIVPATCPVSCNPKRYLMLFAQG